jgi:hypothetical protein
MVMAIRHRKREPNYAWMGKKSSQYLTHEKTFDSIERLHKDKQSFGGNEQAIEAIWSWI